MSLRNRSLSICALFGLLQLGCSNADPGAAVVGDATNGEAVQQRVSLIGEFEVRRLEGLPVGSAARAINARGQVIVNSMFGSHTHAFLWDNGRAIDLGTLGGWYTYAWDLNDEGVVVGVSEDELERRFPFVWKDGVMTALLDNPEDPHQGVAYGTNNDGQVVGVLHADGSHAFSWNGAGFTRLAPPEGESWTRSTAWDVNDYGEIVGDAQSELGPVAAYWSGEGAKALDSSANSQSEAALSVNNYGQSVGRNTDSVFGRRAASWTADGVEYLGFASAMASAVNDAGMIVGKHRMSTSDRRAFLRADGVEYDLHAATPGNPYQNSEAADVDENGRVVGSAFPSGLSWANAEAVIWTPIELTPGGGRF
jgi:probable HAF family extracellular repeat protein